ncbi:ribosomal protein S5 domain 2-type protein [Echria macrotheca]|uniref:Galactokinase n=1 Tax=Echria macrotheca TaxID=438768 RepID=A0AAJ0F8M6_9PEZI|nr:ribosomal protein S5 domain 2-type protein [Echria macrotheca]
MSGIVPTTTTLADVYPADADEVAFQQQRWTKLVDTFAATHGHKPTFVSRSPGRVNIIGEHIDYSLFSVLPMAIAADVLLAVSTPSPSSSSSGDDSFKITISNVQTDKFPGAEFTVSPSATEIEIDRSHHHWSNYFKAGLKGAMGLLRQKHGDEFRFKSMNVVMDGNVPPGGGLSSSAAFVTASALAVLVANGETEVDKVKLTELAIVSEREVGVNSGGMDQSASVLSERDAALFVSFTPSLSARPVRFPQTTPELVFLIAQTFVRSAKFDTAPYRYNLRVVECTLAAAILNADCNNSSPLPRDSSPLGISLHGFFDSYFTTTNPSLSNLTLQEKFTKAISLTEESLTQEKGYTLDEIATHLHLPVSDLQKTYLTKFPAKPPQNLFLLRQRALHVFRESLRVLRFMHLLEQNPPSSSSDIGPSLGRLLTDSQSSCRDDFDCSCAEIDSLVDIGRRAGAYGSRLTGAGWGGCTIHLVPADRVEQVKKAFDDEYYSKIEMSEEERASRVVVTKPGPGSCVFWVSEEGKV